MIYQVRLTRSAEQDLKEALDYIAFILKNPDAADRLLNFAIEKMNTLAATPKIHPIVNDPVLKDWKIRFIPINHYLAFYTIDEEQGSVYILRFLYGKRNWTSILKQGKAFDIEQNDM